MSLKTWTIFTPDGATDLLLTNTMKPLDVILKAKREEQLRLKKNTQSPQEADPHGKKAHEPGAKLDAGKIAVWQGAIGYFPRAIEQIAAVSTFGARKYAWKGWESVPDGINRYSDAMGRHLIEEGSGHVYDKDSELLIAAHTAWNALARLELMLRETETETND